MTPEQLKLENQICFPLYAASRLVIRSYQPYLEKLGLTYPQYLVLMILWEKDTLSVKEIGEKLFLNTNTVTPLLKRMELNGFIKRTRSQTDERKVFVELTKMGWQLNKKATIIPRKLLDAINKTNLSEKDFLELKNLLEKFIRSISDKN